MQLFCGLYIGGRVYTFWEKTTVAICQMLPQEPAVTEFVIAFNQFHAVTLG